MPLSTFGVSQSRNNRLAFGSSINSRGFGNSFRGRAIPIFGASNASRNFGVSGTKKPIFGVNPSESEVIFGASFKGNGMKLDGAARFNSSIAARELAFKTSQLKYSAAPSFSTSNSTSTIFQSSQSGLGSSGRWSKLGSERSYTNEYGDGYNDFTRSGRPKKLHNSGGGLLRRAVDELNRTQQEANNTSFNSSTRTIACFRTSMNTPLKNSIGARTAGSIVLNEPSLDNFGSMKTDWVSYQAQTELIKAKQNRMHE